jgi:hypothetical protein
MAARRQAPVAADHPGKAIRVARGENLIQEVQVLEAQDTRADAAVQEGHHMAEVARAAVQAPVPDLQAAGIN